MRDLYHWMMIIPWWKLSISVLGLFLVSNVIFAGLYCLGGNTISNARAGSFMDHFFFSVQTMSTIGYGHMVPLGVYANLLATLEAMLGLLGFAMAAGLMFAKFSRPTAKVLFSNVAVIGQREGARGFIFRMANERSNRILEAKLSLVFARDEIAPDGEQMRKMYDMKLVRDWSPNFALSWIAWHRIDEHSPLFNETVDSLTESRAEFIVTLSGIDDTFSAVVYSRYSYFTPDVRWDARFRDIFLESEPGVRIMDMDRFHLTEPIGHV